MGLFAPIPGVDPDSTPGAEDHLDRARDLPRESALRSLLARTKAQRAGSTKPIASSVRRSPSLSGVGAKPSSR